MISDSKDEVSESNEINDDDEKSRSAEEETEKDSLESEIVSQKDASESDLTMTVSQHTCMNMSPDSSSTESDCFKSGRQTVLGQDDISKDKATESEKPMSVIKSTNASVLPEYDGMEIFKETNPVIQASESGRNPERVTTNDTSGSVSLHKSTHFLHSKYHTKRKIAPHVKNPNHSSSSQNSIESKMVTDLPLDLSVKKKPKIADKSYSCDRKMFSCPIENLPVKSSVDQSSSLKNLQKLFGGEVPFPYAQTKVSVPVSLKTPSMQKVKSEKFYQCTLNENKSVEKKSVIRDLKVLTDPSTDLLNSLKYTVDATVNAACEPNDTDTKDKTDNKHTTLSCSCHKNFSSLYELSLHLQETGHAPGGNKPANLMDYPKLVRGQDMWLNQESEQTKRILRCMQCGESFRSLPMLTVHMMQTQHYAKIVSAEHGRRSHKCSSYCDSELEKECIFKCKVCDNMFTDMEGLANHMIMSGHHKKQVVRTQNIPDLALRGKRKRSCTDGDVTRANTPSLSSQLEYKRKYFDFPTSLTNTHLIEKESKVLEGLIPCECCGHKIPMKYFADHVRICLRQKSDVIYALKSKLKSESINLKSSNKRLKDDPGEQKKIDGKHSSRRLYSDLYYKHASMYDMVTPDWKDSFHSLRAMNKNLNQQKPHEDSISGLSGKKSEGPIEEKNTINLKKFDVEKKCKQIDGCRAFGEKQHSPRSEDCYSESVISKTSEMSADNSSMLGSPCSLSGFSEKKNPKDCIVNEPVVEDEEKSVEKENNMLSNGVNQNDCMNLKQNDERCEQDEETSLKFTDKNTISEIIKSSDDKNSKSESANEQPGIVDCDTNKLNVDSEQSNCTSPQPELLVSKTDKGVVDHWKRFEKYLQSLQDNIIPKKLNDTGDVKIEKPCEIKDKEDTCKLDIINPDSETDEPAGSSALKAMESFIQKSFKSKFDFHGNRQSTIHNSVSEPLPSTLSETRSKSRDGSSHKLLNGHSSQSFIEKYLQHTENKAVESPLNSTNISKLQSSIYNKSATETSTVLTSPVGSDKTDITNTSSVDEGPIENKYLKMEEENSSIEKSSSALDSLSSFVYGQRMTSEHPLDSLQRLITKSHIPRVILSGDFKDHNAQRKFTPSVSPKMFSGFEESSNKPLNLSLKDKIYDSDDSIESRSKDELLTDEEDDTLSQHDFEHMVYKCIACSRHFASKGSYRYHLSRCHLSTVKKYGIKEAFNLSPYVYLPLDHTAKFSKYYEMAQELASKRKQHEESLSS